MPIHQEVNLPATPDRIYELLTDGEKFAAATDWPAEIGTSEGQPLSVFGGYIEGYQTEFVPGKRVVQAWRGSDWAPGVFSLVRFTLTQEGRSTKLTVDHDSYPEGEAPMHTS